VVRGHRFEVRLSAGEFAAVVGAARVAGRGRVAGWARDVLLATAGRVRVAASGEDVAAARVRGELVRIGSNLNQVARALNQAAYGGEAPLLASVLAVIEDTRAGWAGVRAAWRERGQER
jgi:hypothetical protein